MITMSSASQRRDGESGSVMIAVIGVMAVMMIVGVAVMAATVRSLSYTSSTRAGVQSVAAAESGASVAEVGIRGGTCDADYAQPVAPVFSVEVWYSLSADNDIWVPGCPALGENAQRIKLVSTGTAAAPGVAGNTSGDTSVVEAIYSVSVLPGVHPSGSAMYLFGGVVFKNNADLLVSDGGRAAIQVKQGDMECANNTVIQGDVIVETGDLNITSCTIEGNAWASGNATLGTITGNLTSSSTNLSPTQINSHTQIHGTYTPSAAAPTVPGWFDLAYVPGDWEDGDGTDYKVTNIGADCNLTPTMIMNASNGGKPNIINALGCAAGVTAPSEVKLTGDLVVFAPMFDFMNQVTFKSATADKHKLWFVTPDNTADNLPSCAAGQGNFMMKNGFYIDGATVSAMLYTPCRFEAMNNFTWTGQLYANGANDFKNNTWFESVPLGLPGVDLDTGDPIVGGAIGSDAELGDLISIRDLSSGG